MFYTQITSESTHDNIAIFTWISTYSKPIIELIENTYLDHLKNFKKIHLSIGWIAKDIHPQRRNICPFNLQIP